MYYPFRAVKAYQLALRNVQTIWSLEFWTVDETEQSALEGDGLGVGEAHRTWHLLLVQVFDDVDRLGHRSKLLFLAEEEALPDRIQVVVIAAEYLVKLLIPESS